MKIDKINKERLLAETPILILSSIPHALAKHSPHMILSKTNKLSKYLKEYRKISQIYKKLEKIYINDITALEKIANLINEPFLTRLIHEYIVIYLSRGINLGILDELALRVLAELKQRISNKISILIQWIELIVLLISLFSIVVLLAGFGNVVSFSFLLILITLLSIFFIPFTKIEYLDVYLQNNTNNIIIILYIISIFLLIIGLYLKNFYISSIGFIASFTIIIKSYIDIAKLLKKMENLLYTLRVLTELLSISTANTRIIKMLTEDPRVPREIISVLKGVSLAQNEAENDKLMFIVSETLVSVMRSGREAVLSIRLIHNIIDNIYKAVRKIIMSGVVQLSLLAGSITMLLLVFKYISSLFGAVISPLSLFYGVSINKNTINHVSLVVSLSSSIASMAIGYTIFKRFFTANFATPLILYITTILYTKIF